MIVISLIVCKILIEQQNLNNNYSSIPTAVFADLSFLQQHTTNSLMNHVEI